MDMYVEVLNSGGPNETRLYIGIEWVHKVRMKIEKEERGRKM